MYADTAGGSPCGKCDGRRGVSPCFCFQRSDDLQPQRTLLGRELSGYPQGVIKTLAWKPGRVLRLIKKRRITYSLQSLLQTMNTRAKLHTQSGAHSRRLPA